MTGGVAVWVLAVVVGGIAAQWVAWRFRLPAIVLLFGLGLLLGPGFGVIDPRRTFGASLQPIVGLAVAVVVFEGGLALDMRELRAAGEGVLRLTLIALPISWCLGATAARFVGGLTWGPAVLFGAITVVTGPTVVLPLLRHTRLRRRSAAFLRWEAILNDPIGAIGATLVLEVLLAGRNASGGASSTLLLGMAPRALAGLAAAAACGVVPAFAVRAAFARDQMPEVLKTPLLLATVLFAYALSNLAMDGAGLVAATVFGIALANLHVPGLNELKRFKESLVVLTVSALFVVLTADLDRSVLARVSWPIVGLTLVALFVVRPVSILLATARSGLSGSERVLAAWIAPRGIVAAAVAGAAGLRLSRGGYPTADLVMPSVFALIAATTVLHGFTLRPLARRLGLTLGDQPGLAIVGASGWTIDLAAALTRAGVPVLLVDTFPGALAPARVASVPVLQAEILSRHGAEALGDWPVDYLLATTPDAIYNGLVCAVLAPDLGRERVFQVSPGGETMDRHRGLTRDSRGKLLGEPDWDFASFARRHDEGWRFAVLSDAPPPEGSAPGGAAPDGAAPDGARSGVAAPDDGLTLMRLKGRRQIVVSSAEDAMPVLLAGGDARVVFRRATPTTRAA